MCACLVREPFFICCCAWSVCTCVKMSSVDKGKKLGFRDKIKKMLEIDDDSSQSDESIQQS